MPTKKRTSTKARRPASKPADDQPAGRDPAFMVLLGSCTFPTKPIVRARRRLLDARERGDVQGVESAIEDLEFMLHVPPEEEWLRKTGLPSPCEMGEWKERMAAAGFSPDTIAAGEWYPQSVASIILGKGRLCEPKPSASPPPPLEKDDVKILESLARRNGIVAYQHDITEVGRDRASDRLKYLASIGYVQNPPGNSTRGWTLTAAGMSRLAELPAVD